MTVITYPASSPYSQTPQYSWRIGIFSPIDIPPDSSDIDFVVKPKYNNNPMSLSQDIYGTPALWWVFSQRNIDVLRDPIWDLVGGLAIKIPTEARLASLGISTT